MARQLRFLFAALPFFALALTPFAAQGQTAALVEDIATQEASFDLGRALPPLRAVGERLFFLSQDPNLHNWLTTGSRGLSFVGDDGVHGRELWRTDGTAAGTRLVQDIASEGLR